MAHHSEDSARANRLEPSLKSIPGLIEYMKQNPAKTAFVIRTVTQMLASVALSRVELSPSASAPDQRRLVAQRLTRSIIGGMIGIGGPVVACSDKALSPANFASKSHKMAWIIRALFGYFASDTIEIFYSRAVYGCPPQWDLFIHHVVGAAGFSALFGREYSKSRGHFWAGMALSGEALTLLTGTTFYLTALPKGHPSRALLSTIAKMRLVFLQYGRVPMWLIFVVHRLYILAQPKKTDKESNSKLHKDNSTPKQTWLMLGLLCFALGLDSYWIRMLREAYGRGASNATELV